MAKVPTIVLAGLNWFFLSSLYYRSGKSQRDAGSIIILRGRDHLEWKNSKNNVVNNNKWEGNFLRFDEFPGIGGLISMVSMEFR